MSTPTSPSPTPSSTPDQQSEVSHPIQRTPVNPWPWSLNFGYNQAELVEGATRHLNCAGQTSLDADGTPQHLDDMRAQIELTLDNLEAVLGTTDINLADVTRLDVYATDVDEAMRHFDVLGARFVQVAAAPPITLLGVTRLAVAGLMFEIAATVAN